MNNPYDNSRRCKPCSKPKPEEKESMNKVEENKETSSEPSKPESSVKPVGSGSLGTIECGKKILSITKVGERVVVMYDDCSYSTAPLDIVAKESFSADAMKCLAGHVKAVVAKQAELDKKIEELANKADKDTIYDDSALTARVTALEDKPDNDTIYDDSELKTKLGDLNQAITLVQNQLTNMVRRDELIIVENLEGTKDLFKAFPLE